MPDDLNGEHDKVASPVAASDDQTAVSSSSTDAIDASSSATDEPSTDDQPKSMADAIAAAFDATTKTPAEGDGQGGEADEEADGQSEEDGKSTSTGDEAGSETQKQADGDDDAEPSKEELAAMTPNARNRIQKLAGQSKVLRQQVTELQPDATNYRQLRTFMDRESLTDDHVVELLKLGADLQSGDPKRLKAFVDRVNPTMRMALEAIGAAVPQDLSGRVDSGEMTEEAARELARVRFERDVATTHAHRATTQADSQAAAQTRAAVHQAVANWHQQTAQSDPDFELKLDVMKRTAQAIVAERGHPRTPQEAVEFAQLAHNEATALVRRVQPSRAPTRPTPNGNTSVNRSGVKASPTSLQDAIGRAFESATRG